MNKVTVKDLVKALQNFPQDAEINLAVGYEDFCVAGGAIEGIALVNDKVMLYNEDDGRVHIKNATKQLTATDIIYADKKLQYKQLTKVKISRKPGVWKIISKYEDFHEYFVIAEDPTSIEAGLFINEDEIIEVVNE